MFTKHKTVATLSSGLCGLWYGTTIQNILLSLFIYLVHINKKDSINHINKKVNTIAVYKPPAHYITLLPAAVEPLFQISAVGMTSKNLG